MTVAADQPHRRRNPLTGDWVLVSPHRLARPWQGQQDVPDRSARPSYDPGCYLCPGNARAGDQRNPDYAGTFVFDNDFAAVLPDTLAASTDDALFAAEAVRGVARVICYSPDHALTMPELSQAAVRGIVDCWCDQSATLGERYRWVQVFENKGAMMGCSNPHPHGQIWATAHLPTEAATEDATQRAYHRDCGRPMLLDVAEREAGGAREVASNAEWLAIVPYWASWPFETLLLPRFAIQRMPELTQAQRDSLADILRCLTARYDNLFATRFPYSMGWHGAPFGDEDGAHWQLHAHFYPPLLRSASVRKFMVGYEMLAEPQRDLTPETAAAMLRAVPEALA
ncbi:MULTISPECIES: UDP-glucose--hexose-1-phosphate uridylyltransferase [Sphingomonas]|uniref:UDP-glucose--hexose-1-phosphate uridylyltransferase n=1 Tax=Sphingomonas TaxID=13687 RepID=UPI000835BCC0|nr:UDP-glucose--hexose-1-phosphate uridylyltransferase [Sphingomonas sp. CCH10-B3]